MRHWPANDTVRYQLLPLRITREAAVEYFKFQMVMTAAKKVFGTFWIFILKSNHSIFLHLGQFRTTMSTVLLNSKNFPVVVQVFHKSRSSRTKQKAYYLTTVFGK